MGESVDPRAALSDARPEVLWLSGDDRPPAAEPLTSDTTVDLLVVGAGYTGLWAAIQAKEDDPSLDVMVIDAGRVGAQASGRNGGFCSSSLTHGLDNGVARFAGEIERVEALARANFAAIESALTTYDIDAEWEATGNLTVAVAPHLVEGLLDYAGLARRFGHEVEVLDRDGVRAEVASPTYEAGIWQRTGEAMVHPAKLAWGLADAARSLGVVMHEHTSMSDLTAEGDAMSVATAGSEAGHATIRARSVFLATNGFRSPVRAINRTIAPVYDYVLATEPLSAAQLDALGWRNRQGVSDSTNLFHYYRLTADDRIVWGGYDAVYHFGNRIDPSLEQHGSTHETLAKHFFETFPQLGGVRFSHRWAGVIDTCTRFSVSFGTSFGGRVSYAVGYTGLGVGASRFGARVGLDLLLHPDSELLELDLVRSRPFPLPPEPLRWSAIELTRRAMAKADANQGRRGPWLRLLDRLGLGFDS